LSVFGFRGAGCLILWRGGPFGSWFFWRGKFREISCFGLASVATTLWPSHGSEITRDLSNVYFAKKNTFANIIWFHTGSVKSFLGFLIVKKVSDHFLS
jgi:hypothetical protein